MFIYSQILASKNFFYAKTLRQSKRLKMGKLFTIIVAIILLINNKEMKADYSPLPLNHMILTADLVIYGEIEKIENSSFVLKIEGEAYGEYDGSSIKVKQFQNWTCAERWTGYEVGQNVFLFLKKEKNNEWKIMSAGGEGELPIANEHIYLYAYYAYYMPFVYYERKGLNGHNYYYKFQTFEIYGSQFSGVKFNFEMFLDAVRGLRDCFKFIKGNTSPENKINLICTKEELKKYKKISKLHSWLAKTCINY